MKILSDVYITALIVLQTRGVYSQTCFNNRNYTFGNDEAKTCNWLRNQDNREELCDEEEIILNCPVSCAVCCKDDPTYTFLKNKRLKEENCEWIDKKAKKKKYCDTYSNGQMIRNGCPRACNHCIKSVTNAPTQSNIACDDNASYVYDENINHTCSWVRKKRRERLCLTSEVVLNCPFSCGHCCEDDPMYRIKLNGNTEKKCMWLDTDDKRMEWCNTFNSGQMVRKGCPKACNNCLSKVTSVPSLFPSSSPPTKLATILPTYIPTDKPTKAPILSPTKKPTRAPIIPPTKKPDKTKRPVSAPTKKPVGKPTKRPSTKKPVRKPTKRPSTTEPTEPTEEPTTSIPTTSEPTTLANRSLANRPLANRPLVNQPLVNRDLQFV